ncbi:hypothetical protein VQL36_03770 [Chengkuizengella sp. SCS-71B]|uniref:glycine-rich protein n=1 Tax=Chengkuizengella sp. SCS-71B TaxID=3115290 RepID=UPI0032C213D0
MLKKITIHLMVFTLALHPILVSIASVSVGTNSSGQATYTFNNTSAGSTGTIQTWVVPETGEYQIEVWGAEGGLYGGQGAYVSGIFDLNQGDRLRILVGQKGGYSSSAPSGGGGSFVVTDSNTPLIVAGGGGGACYSTSSSDGKGTYSSSPSGGSKGSDGAAGGGGFSGDGDKGHSTHGGYSFLNGGNGGPGDDGGASGGFGGGGGGDDDGDSCSGSGGGGGYQGGNGGSNGSYGTGGYSYNAGFNKTSTSGVRSGHGQVVITLESQFLVLWDDGFDDYNITFNHTSTGSSGTIQTWVVPETGTYTIETWGAEGGRYGGRGAYVSGNFELNQGDRLRILVGQAGGYSSSAPSGGGGTFVVTNSNAPLIVAGGGGGACYRTSSSDGKGIYTLSTSGGNQGSSGAPGGGGFSGDGEDGDATHGGYSFLNGGNGGPGDDGGASGGFGGGGGGDSDSGDCTGPGGGGGYRGGNGGTNDSYGTGGYSYNTGSNKSSTSGVRSGHGQVIITLEEVGQTEEGNQFPNLLTVGEPIHINLSNPNNGKLWEDVKLIIEFIDNNLQKTTMEYSLPDTSPSGSRELDININVPSLVGGTYTVRYKLQDSSGNLADKMQQFSDIVVTSGLKVDFSEDNTFPLEWLESEKKQVEIAFKNLENKTLKRDDTVMNIGWYVGNSLKQNQTIQMTANIGSNHTMVFTGWVTPPSDSGTYKVIYTVENKGLNSSHRQEFSNIVVKGATTEWRIFDFSLVNEDVIYWTGRRFDADHDITIDDSSNPVKVTVEYRVPLMFPVVRYLGGGSWDPFITVESTAEMKIEEPEF